MTSSISASSYTSGQVDALATADAVLYQRDATNVLDSSLTNAVSIGTLTTNQTQLDVTSQVTAQNQSDYYQFSLNGTSLKLDLDNVTNSSKLRVQLYNSQGTLVADSDGTQAQQTAYLEANSELGLTAKAGNYTVKVSFMPTSLKSVSQTYSLQLYSGTKFSASYETTAGVQTSPLQPVAVDNTMTYATADAQLNTRQGYNEINDTAQSGINIGWLAANKTQLSVESQLTTADNTDYYRFTLQSGTALKLAFNNTTTTGAANTRVQLLDTSGLRVIADNEGTAAQQAAYQELTSSTGLAGNTGQYVVKVTYGQGAARTNTQNYNFQITSGDTYNTSDETIASAESEGIYMLEGGTGSYNAASAAASYLNGVQNGDTTDLFQTLSTLV